MPDPELVSRCVDYTLRLLLGDQFEQHCQGRKITYLPADGRIPEDTALWIVASNFFGNDYGTPRSLPTSPLKEIEGVPLLYGTPEVVREGNRLKVSADIVASAYFMVTRYEEVVRRHVRDMHGRFPGKGSLPFRCHFLNRPIVDEYACLLRRWLQEVGVNIPEPPRRFSALLTHDVDNLRMYRNASQVLRTIGKAILGRCPLRDFPMCLGAFVRVKKDPLDTFDEIVRLDRSLNEKRLNGRSESMYFFAVRKSPQRGTNYDIHSRPAKQTIRRILESGGRIGLHASYEAGIHPDLLREEKTLLEGICGFPIRHNRHHFLNWREVEDGWALAKAGIECDYTLGYADIAGFRLGVCHPIPLFDPNRMEPFGIQEHPLIVMDVTLSGTHAMALGEAEALEYSKRLIRETKKHRGQFVMLWHNDRLVRKSGNYHPRLYGQLLEELACC